MSSARTQAARMPAMPPNRWPCQEIPSCGSRPPSSALPQTTTTTMPISTWPSRRLNRPRVIRYAAYPKTRPLAPIVIVFGGEISQVPNPPITTTIAVTANNRRAPLTAMIRPRVTRGSVFEIR